METTDSYLDFARFYDELMEDAQYTERCDQILKICEKHRHSPGLILDLACGTGNLILELQKRGVEVIGVDLSADMLTEAAAKCGGVLFLRQGMQELNIGKRVDTCVCTLDSINHLTELSEVKQTFERVSRHLRPGGMFIFDVNTVYKHRCVLADNCFVMETDGLFCAWQNFPADGNLVEICLDFFEKNPQNGSYHRYSEYFCERAYTKEELEGALREAGLELEAIYGDLRLAPPRDDEQREVYAARKPKI